MDKICKECNTWAHSVNCSHFKTSDRAGKSDLEKRTEVIREYMKYLQKLSAKSRAKRDPNTYKKMARLRWERNEDLDITVE